MFLRPRRTLANAALALALTACGGGGADDNPTQPVLRDTRVLSAAGGTLVVDGAALTLPADALQADTELTLEQLPADPAAGELLHLRLSPAGRRLAATAELAVDLPAAPADTQAFWDVGGDLVLAPSTRSGDRFTLRLDSLGVDGDGRRLDPAAAKPSGRRHALAAASPAGGDLKLQVQDCQAKARALTRRLAAMLQRDAIDEAQLLSDALVDLVQQCQALEVQQAQAEACTQQAAAVAALQQSAPPTLAELDERVRDLLGTTDAVRKVLASCPVVPEVDTLLRASIEQYTRVLKADLDAGRLEGAAGARELSRLFAVDADCQLLGLDDACTVLRTEVFPEVLNGMRVDAFAECRERGSSLPVSQLIDLGVFTGREGKFLDFARYTTADLELDAAMCTAPELQVRVFGSDDALDDRPDLDTRIVALGALGQYTQRGEVRPPRAGRIVLSGPIKVSRCPDGNALGADLVVRLATNDGTGAVLARRPHDGTRFTLDSAPIDLSLPQILATAGQDPASATGVSLTLTQEGGACTSLLDEDKVVLTSPVRLFQLDLVFGLAESWRGTVTLETQFSEQLRSSYGLTFLTEEESVCGTSCGSIVSSHSVSAAWVIPVEMVADLAAGTTRSLVPSGQPTLSGSWSGQTLASQLFEQADGCTRSRSLEEGYGASPLDAVLPTLTLQRGTDDSLRLAVAGDGSMRFSGPQSSRLQGAVTCRTSITNDPPVSTNVTVIGNLATPAIAATRSAAAAADAVWEGEVVLGGNASSCGAAAGTDSSLVGEVFNPGDNEVSVEDQACPQSTRLRWRLERQR